MAFTKNVRTFDNHVTKQYYSSSYNPFMMNPNIYYDITANDNYYKKYPFSTLMLIMAYYDIPLPKSDIGKDLILACDSAFKGHYTSNKFFKDIHTTWLERMGFDGLIDRLNANTMKYYYDLQEEYKLNEKIHINEQGLLTSNIKFEEMQSFFDWKIGLSDNEFTLVKKNIRTGHSINQRVPERDQLISLAYTSKAYVSYTYKA
ncbi:hypothetical protein [Heyndrickxia sp. FSL W8-0423]|uniref:hypothetical protein n=1 Tax=Heyndrickxia sp. FSL W8-0423 TaxID=2921601 RepID=UPI0030FAD640